MSAPQLPWQEEVQQRLAASAERVEGPAGVLHLEQSAQAIAAGRSAVVTCCNEQMWTLLYLSVLARAARPVIVLESHPQLLAAEFDRLGQLRFKALPLAKWSERSQHWQAGTLELPPIYLASPKEFQRHAALSAAEVGQHAACIVVRNAQAASPYASEYCPAYSVLGESLAHFANTPVLALTRPAAPRVLQQLIAQLGLRKAALLGANMPIQFASIQICSRFEANEDPMSTLLSAVQQMPRPGIVYCNTADLADRVYSSIRANRLPVHRFHRALPSSERASEQLHFQLPGRRAIMVATSVNQPQSGLLGLGLRADEMASEFGDALPSQYCRFVLHFGRPASLEQYARDLAAISFTAQSGQSIVIDLPEDESHFEALHSERTLLASRLVAIAKQLGRLPKPPREPGLEANSVDRLLAEHTGLSLSVVQRLFSILEERGAVDLDKLEDSQQQAFAARQAIAISQVLTAMLEFDQDRADACTAALQSQRCITQAIASYFGTPVANCGKCSACDPKLERQFAPASPRILENEVPRGRSRPAATNFIAPHAVIPLTPTQLPQQSPRELSQD